ncbi:MAG TPA: SRPBCC family protein [Acidimicrobiales bacterium]
MAESAHQTISIAASPEHCWDVVVDFPRYPEWVKDLRAVEVKSVDAEGRPEEVEFTAAAIGRSTRYTLWYDWSAAPQSLSWKLVQGDIMRAIDGTYHFAASESVPGGTDVQYDLAIELVVPLAGFVKRRAEVRILMNALKALKARAEA